MKSKAEPGFVHNKSTSFRKAPTLPYPANIPFFLNHQINSMIRIVYAIFICCCSFIAQSQQLPSLNGVTLGPGVEQYQQKLKDSTTLILTFETKESAIAARKLLSQQGVAFEGPVFNELPIQGVRATGGDVEWLSRLQGTLGIWENRKLHGELHQAVIASRVKDTWEDAAFTALNRGLPVSGRGVGVLVNDSGYDGDATDIEAKDTMGYSRRIVQNVKSASLGSWVENAGADNTADIRDTDQGGGHGSHCMGIVGGDGRFSNGKYTGVAPQSTLIGYGSGAGLNILDVAGGFEYAIRHAKDYNIRVMSNSFGTTSDTTFTSFNPSNPTSIATKILSDMGVVVVFSAGNEGTAGDGKITGNYKTAPWVVCVGNGLKTGSLASGSSRGRPKDGNPNNNEAMQATVNVGGKSYLWENRPTLTAPGTDITAVRATAGPVSYVSTSTGELTPAEIPYYTILSGTSMACPHVAGVIALMMEANPNLEWRAVKAILQRTTVPMTEKKFRAGAGYVNAHAAVAAAFYGLCDVPAGSSYDAKYGLPTNGNFGFDTDPWKTCPLKPEVDSRIALSMPSLTGVQSECSANVPLTDATGAADVNGGTVPPNPPAYFDIKQVSVTNENSTSFDITLEVAGQLALSPPGGPPSTSQHFYDVHFVLDKISPEGVLPEPQVSYIVSAYDSLTIKKYKLTVRSTDGTTRPNTNVFHNENITGTWNTANNTITWTVPKSSLNVSKLPATTSAAGERNSRAAKAGDRLKSWEAYVYERAAIITPDGPGVYSDKATGQCFKTLAVE